MKFIENDAEIIYEGKKLRFDTTEGIQRAEAFIRMKEVIDLETGLKVPRTKVSFCYNSLTPKAPSEPFVVPCIEGRGRKKKGENIMTHVVMRFPSCVCVPIAVRTQATRTVKGSDPITAKIALEIAKKWVKATYGNIDYMCGIHIDQPDMLVHFLMFVKEANEAGEENARKLFLAYHLDKFLEELQSEETLVEEEQEQIPEKNSTFSMDYQINMEKETVVQEPREEILTKMKEETIYATKPSERQDQIDIASIVAKVRASSSFQVSPEKEEKAKEQITKDLEGLFKLQSEITAQNNEREKEEVVEFKEEILTGSNEEEMEESIPEEDEEEYMDPIEKIKANAASQLFGLSRVLEPAKSSQNEEESVEEMAEPEPEKPEIKVSYSDETKKEDEDKQLYPDADYPKVPMGNVVWGTETAEDKFPEEKRVQAVFSTRNLSVMAEDSNPYADDLDDDLPEITFLVQNEAGEKEVPEEFSYEPSERTLQQRDAAASYVKSLQKAKWKKFAIIGAILLIIAIVVIFIL